MSGVTTICWGLPGLRWGEHNTWAGRQTQQFNSLALLGSWKMYSTHPALSLTYSCRGHNSTDRHTNARGPHLVREGALPNHKVGDNRATSPEPSSDATGAAGTSVSRGRVLAALRPPSPWPGASAGGGHSAPEVDHYSHYPRTTLARHIVPPLPHHGEPRWESR